MLYSQCSFRLLLSSSFLPLVLCYPMNESSIPAVLLLTSTWTFFFFYMYYLTFPLWQGLRKETTYCRLRKNYSLKLLLTELCVLALENKNRVPYHKEAKYQMCFCKTYHSCMQIELLLRHWILRGGSACICCFSHCLSKSSGTNSKSWKATTRSKNHSFVFVSK